MQEPYPIIFSDVLYHDFFAPRRNTQLKPHAKDKAQSTAAGRVRFHDEVRVKKIKSKGKSLPLSLLYASALGDDEEEDGKGFAEEFDLEEDESLASATDTIWRTEGTDVVMSDDEEPVDGGSDDFTQSQDSEADDNRITIERLKDDLFADDDENKNDSTSNSKGVIP
jgi:U3 small nucleolar RNA-associated protein MPP10